MALRETATHTSPSHHYVRLRSLLPTRLSSFPVVSSLLYAFPVFPIIHLLFSSSLVLDYSRRFLLFGLYPIRASICALVSFCELSNTFSVLFGGYFIRLVLLLLGLTSAKSRPHVQLIRAELSSKGSSEPPSESLSKLSSHQIPRCIVSEGTTTAKGLYANSFYVLSHYAFGGVSAQCVLFALSTPLRLRGRTGVFRRREGPPRLPISGIPFFRL